MRIIEIVCLLKTAPVVVVEDTLDCIGRHGRTKGGSSSKMAASRVYGWRDDSGVAVVGLLDEVAGTCQFRVWRPARLHRAVPIDQGSEANISPNTGTTMRVMRVAQARIGYCMRNVPVSSGKSLIEYYGVPEAAEGTVSPATVNAKVVSWFNATVTTRRVGGSTYQPTPLRLPVHLEPLSCSWSRMTMACQSSA